MAAEVTACLSADFFDSLAALKINFTNDVFAAMGKQARPTLGKLFVLWIMWQGVMMAVKPASASERLRGLVEKGLLVATCCIALLPTASNPAPLVYQWAVQPYEEMAIAYGNQVLDVMAAPQRDGAVTPYGQLACGVESQMMGFLMLITNLVTDNFGSWYDKLSGGFLVTVVAFFLLALPFLFVIAIFGAFLLEAMFKITAVGIVSPLIILCIPFAPLRPFAIAAIRIVVGAGLTIILICGAFGFTMTAIATHGENLAASMSAGINSVKTIQAQMDKLGCNQMTGGDDETSGEGLERWKQCQLLKQQLDAANAKGGTFAVLTPQYFILFVIGFASILLHLQAKTLASNISGAQDGAGPAAATVAAAKATLGVGAYYGSRALFGAGGARGSLIGALAPGGGLYDGAGHALSAGQLVQQHGMAGGVIARAIQATGIGADGAQAAAQRAAAPAMAGSLRSRPWPPPMALGWRGLEAPRLRPI